MRLAYKILWIEDESSFVESEIESVQEFLENYGFELDCENIEKYEKRDFSNYDVIVVDCNLADEEKGREVIERIRNRELFTDILFYSVEGEKELRKKLASLKGGQDGVYCASKDTCGEKLQGLIKSTIKKTQDLNNLRGLVMAETGELDEQMKTILKTIAENGLVEEDKIIGRAERLNKRYNDKIADIAKHVLPRDFSDLVDSRHFEANFSRMTLETFSKSDLNSLSVEAISPYKNLQDIRNILAHCPEDESTSETMVIKKDDGSLESYTEESFIEIRKDIQKYKIFFESIINELNS